MDAQRMETRQQRCIRRMQAAGSPCIPNQRNAAAVRTQRRSPAARS